MPVTTFLMFQGKAQQAIDLYTSVIPRTTVEEVMHFDPEQVKQMTETVASDENPAVDTDGPLVMMAVLNVDGLRLQINDSPIQHQFDFTPSASLYFETHDQAEYEAVLAGLSEGGTFMMEDRDDYGFAERYAWLNDRYGVSWQLAYTSGQ